MRKMMASPEAHIPDPKSSWPLDGAGRSRCGAAFDLLSTLAKCDFLWSAGEANTLIPANG